MKKSTHNLEQARSFSVRISSAMGLLLTLSLLLAPSASATFEQVTTFADKGINTQLSQTGGMAVNVTGAGGVPAGTVYAIRDTGSGTEGITSYNYKGEFPHAWGPSKGKQIAVDQTTGNVYVLVSADIGTPDVSVYSPDGSQLIASFGIAGSVSESIDESPERIHSAPIGIAVDSSGVVYVSEVESRVMVFEPQSPGDYEHYVYAGRSHDFATREGSVKYFPERLAIDSAGNLYLVSGENAIYEFAPGDRTAPTCEFKLPAGGIQGITVNPESGEVFYFTYKNRKIHQLAPCNAQGKLVETTSFAPSPATKDIYGLAFNPAIAYEASRPAGVLYAACYCEEEKREGPLPQATELHGRGFIFAPPVALQPPSVESESVSLVTASTATLGAQIDPKSSPTRYVFQYLTDAAYQANEPSERFAGASEAPLGGALLGTGTEVLSASTSLTGLLPDTEYRYRAIATSHCNPDDEEELCEGTGPAQAFRTFAAEAPGLPDNRAWELVSPAQKYGGEVFPANHMVASCGVECKPQGRGPKQSTPDGEAVAYVGTSFSFTEGAVGRNEYVARRTAAGWQTTILSPILGGAYSAFNTELTQGLLAHGGLPLTPEAPSEYENLYTQPTANPSSLSALIGVEPPNRPTGTSFRPILAGASADFSQLFFEANDVLTEETPFAPEAVDGGESKNNLYESVGGQLRLVNVLPGNTETVPGAVFGSGIRLGGGDASVRPADYSHTISVDGSRAFWSDESGQAYVREDGQSTSVIPDPGEFLTASADGSQVLLSNGHLYDLEEEATLDLTQGKGGFQGIAGQSNDLSRIYFVDTAVLTGEEENDQGAKAQAAQNNLYAWHEGTSVFIATLVAGDNADPLSGTWQASPLARTAEASPDGRWVAFLSRAQLTGYDNTGPCNAGNTSPCAEVFLYDSASGRLSCPSCNPSGTRPLGPSRLTVPAFAPRAVPQPRYLTDAGRLYFDTQDSLSPFDTNDGVEDVYQYEPEGIGSCKREGGCVSLISAGHEPIDSNFFAADESGKNVFFTSRDQLVLKDRDDLIDLYVAREGGGIASETEAVKPSCQGEACVPAIAPPNDPTPGSSTFEGAGNVDEKKAAKKKQKKAKKHKKKHAKKQKSHKRSHGRAANNNRGGAK